jgi:hypothetical protein
VQVVSWLAAALKQEAEAIAGEPALGHLCETCLDLLTELNHPHGACVFCLDSMEGCAADAALVLRCYHCFHL